MRAAQATEGEPSYMMGAENPIKDRTFLGKKVAKLCVGVDVYWSMPSCGEPEVNVKTEEAGEVAEVDETPENSKSSDAIKYQLVDIM